MKMRALLGVLALFPSALNASPAAARGIAVPLCDGPGGTATVTLPLGGSDVPGKEAPGCCAKGCHTGSRKKNLSRQIDAGQ